MKDIYILGIESSCDETSCSIVKNGCEEIATIILSQIDIHTLYGGVVPEIASRNHVKDITFVIEKCLKESKLSMDDITAIAVTYGPGLIGSLLVGIEAAKTMAYIYNKPLIPVHHIAGHIYANNIEKKMQFPLMCLVISGGHTELVYMKEHYSFEVVGSTLDDAVGECFDKVARVIGIGYPGGPQIDKLAKLGNDTYKLPIPLNDDSYNFSFSGIKSYINNLVHNEIQRKNDINKENLCCSFQNAVTQLLVSKTENALINNNVKNLIIAGGVASNTFIRNKLIEMCKKNNISINIPDKKYCTDNATMIGAAAYQLYLKKEFSGLDTNAKSNDIISI